MTRWLAFFTLSVFATPGFVYAQTHPTVIRIGALDYLGQAEVYQRWQPTADYLSRQIPEYQFVIVPLGYDVIMDAVRQGKVDFITMEPSNFAALEHEQAVNKMVTLKSVRRGVVCRDYGAVIFCRADRIDIQSLRDLRGRNFLAYNERAFGGWRMAWREFKAKGIDPYKDLRQLTFLCANLDPNKPPPGQMEIVKAVQDRKADAGCVRTGVLEQLAESNQVDLSTLRILNEQPASRTLDFPFILSTRRYPEWPFAAAKHVSEDLTWKVASALLRLSPDSPEAKASRCAGWTIPSNYEEVFKCLKELRLPPFEHHGEISLWAVLQQYGYWAGVVIGMLLMLTTAYYVRNNRRLRSLRKGLETELRERTAAEEALRLDEKRLQTLMAMSQMGGSTLQEITHFAMEQAVVLTKSSIGYIAYMNEDESELTMYAWSRQAMAECAIVDKPIVYPVVKTGLWGEAVRQRQPIITNNYQAPNPLKKGYPKGHVDVHRHMNIPVFDGKKIVAVGGVGNKAEPYDESDVRQLQLLMDGMWKIVQRQRGEEAIRKINRELRMLSDCNQVLVRSDNEQALLNNICQTIVLVGGYRMAWVGYAMNDEEKTVRPMAWAGHEDGYLQNIGVTWNDNPRGHSPVGRAIRTGKSCICADIQSDPDFALWVDEAARRGYVSVIAVPLILSDKPFGAIMIYSDKPADFSEQELNLLAELAGDLAYGIETIRTRAARERAEQAIRKVNRELRMLSDCNQVLVRSDNELTLLKEICQTIVTIGGYRMAWVGYAMNDEGKTVRPMAWAGHEDGYLQTIRISWADVPHGQGPTGVAVREGKPVTCQDFSNPSMFLPWPQEARKRGYASMAALPLLAEGKSFGAMNLYSQNTGEFSEDEVRLLTELAGDLAYGIAALRTQTQRHQAEEAVLQMNEQLEERVRQRTAELEQAVHAEREARQAVIATQNQLIQSEKMASLGQLVAGVAHEINNPLAFVSNNFVVLQRDMGSVTDVLGMYREGAPLLAEHQPDLYSRIQMFSQRVDMDYTVNNLQELVTRSREGLRRIQQIVQDLRDFARMDEGHPQEIDLNAGIESTVNILVGQAKRKRVRMDTDLQPLPPVTCFPAKISQVVMNLVSNALDACSEGGQVAVQTKASDDKVQIEVTDNGHGIPPELLNRIFDPFFTTKPQGEGLGLGLSISYSIVHDHGGTIEVFSEPGKGSRFVVTLPVRGNPKWSRAAGD